MYAIVETRGVQVKVEPNQMVVVPRLEKRVGEEIALSPVLFLSKGDEFFVGKPEVEGARVLAKVVSHGHFPKIVGFKYKKRKNYRRKWGAKQEYTELFVTEITSDKETLKTKKRVNKISN